MGAPLPLSVKVERRCIDIVIEPTFALSPLGLVTTMRLARTEHVWLPRSLRGILDHNARFLEAPGELALDWLPEEGRASAAWSMAEQLALWHRAWTYGRLAAQIHWIGDAQYESLLPDRADALLLTRFEACADALDRRCIRTRQPIASRLQHCSRDALALAAALQPDPVSILTQGSADGARPPLCAWLETIGIPARPVPVALASARLRDLGLAEALLPAAIAGQPVALVHVVAPGVLTMPETWSDGDWLDEYDEAGEDLRARIWSDAFALWQTVEAMP
jgi:hypothetical protein